MANENWRRVDIPYNANLVGFRAEARSGEVLSLTDDPQEPIFVRTRDGDLWSAGNFMAFHLKKEGRKIQDYAPPSLLEANSAEVDFPVPITPEGTFHVKTDSGPVDISVVIPCVGFRRIKHK